MNLLRKGTKAVVVVAGLLLLLLAFPSQRNNISNNLPQESEVQAEVEVTVEKPPSIEVVVGEYLKSKGSPLADHTEILLQQPHWKLLIAISHIESSWCTRKISYNCWGIGGDAAYRRYSGYDEAIIDANNLIQRWQDRGRWLTVADMNGHYVQPHNPNWERVVNLTLNEIENLIK